jgi:hypothetical protein
MSQRPASVYLGPARRIELSLWRHVPEVGGDPGHIIFGRDEGKGLDGGASTKGRRERREDAVSTRRGWAGPRACSKDTRKEARAKTKTTES